MSGRTSVTAYIANKIIALRRSVNWSQSELARQAGITIAAINLLKKGDRMPALASAIKLADVFRITVSELIGNTETSPSSNKEANLFFIKFGNIKSLSKSDQRMIHALVDRLNNY